MRRIASQHGISLVEVIVSLLLLAIAVLGYLALQTTAIQSTDESLQRTQSLTMMRSLAEKIRLNPAAKENYYNLLNKSVNSEPSNKCGVVSSSDSSITLCSSEALAAAEMYYFKQELDSYDFDIQMHPCPSNKKTDTNSVMFAYCLISAWGNTTPTIGDDSTTTNDSPKLDCLAAKSKNATSGNKTPAGSYHPDATCVMLEL